MGVFRKSSSSRPIYSDPSRWRSRWNPFRRRHRLPSFGPSRADGGLRRPVGRVLLLPIRIFLFVLRLPIAVVIAVVDGWKQRRLRHLVQALPAVFAVVAVTSAAGAIWLGRADLIPDYRRAAASAFAAGDYEAARSYFERLHGLDGGTPDTRFNLALTYEKLDEGERAEAMMKRLLGGSEIGDPRAHLWYAEKLLADARTFQDPSRLATAHRHLLRANQGAPNNPVTSIQLARYYEAVGDDASAAAHLESAAAAVPGLYFDLAAKYERMGREESKLRVAALAEAHFRREIRSRPEDQEARIRWATCLIALGRFDEGVEALRQGLSIDPGGPYRDLLARSYVARFEQLKSAEDPRLGLQLDLLRQALEVSPSCVPALVRLIEFVDEPRANSLGQEAERLLTEILGAGEVPALAHMALGLQKWKAGDQGRGEWHLTRAYELNPSLADVANNLAWMLAHRPDPDLARASAMIEDVVRRFPGSPIYRDTRGHINAKLGRWNDALTDFEKSIAAAKDQPAAHRTIAEAYERTGNPDLAAFHRRRAEDLSSRVSEAVGK